MMDRMLSDAGTMAFRADVGPPNDDREEALIAELELLGIQYLSRQTPNQATHVRAPEALLADLIRQPSARVRAAVIALLLAHPEYTAAVPAALKQLQPGEQLTLRLFYTAAMLLQQEYAEKLRPHLGSRWQWLPDLFSAEVGVPTEGLSRQRLVALGQQHRHRTKAAVNWTGTYENVAQRLLRSWELEVLWNR